MTVNNKPNTNNTLLLNFSFSFFINSLINKADSVNTVIIYPPITLDDVKRVP